MFLNTVIFDMDGLLIDSEPCWQQACTDALKVYDIALTDEQYHSTTGLRTPEWIEWWFRHFAIDNHFAADAIKDVESRALNIIRDTALAMPGVHEIFRFFKDRNFKTGLASSSPISFIEVVTAKLGIAGKLDAFTSAQSLKYGKPHPEVFLNCAIELGSSPLECLCFEDSFNGLIAAKAARMKCVVAPAPSQNLAPRWVVADQQIGSLLEFNDELLEIVNG